MADRFANVAYDYDPSNAYTGNYSSLPSSGGSGLGGGLGGMFGGGGNLGGALSGILGGLFGGRGFTNPADPAMKYLNQIQGTISPYYQPYINAGNQALGSLMPQYQQLLSNPGGFMNQMGQSFQQSPGFKFNVDEATRAANQASAAGGMVGSPAEQQQLAGTVTNLANQDYNNWLNKALGLYGQGLGGMGNMAQLGYGASSGLAENLAQALMSQANMAYAGQNTANQQSGGGFGSFLGGAASLLGGLL